VGIENPISSADSLSWNERRERGTEIEHKVAGLIRTLPHVISVKETEKLSREDINMIDLVVTVDGDSEMLVHKVFVQIKASTKGVEHFEKQVSQRIKRKKRAHEQIDRRTWLLQNHRIILNGDIKMTKSHKHRRQLSDEEILADFEKQLKEIDTYEKNKSL
jgi:hypothetical protein